MVLWFLPLPFHTERSPNCGISLHGDALLARGGLLREGGLVQSQGARAISGAARRAAES
jgi:hypothetical protein